MVDHEDGAEFPKKAFDACIVNATESHRPIQRNKYLKSGKYPVIDQGQDLVGGYTDDADAVYSQDLPLIIFGDHTRIFKYIDVPFAAGADGVKIIKPNPAAFDPKFLYYGLKYTEVPSRGYNRHYSVLREQEIPCPVDKSEQRAIAGVLDQIQKAIAIQDKAISSHKELKVATMDRLFSDGVASWPQVSVSEYFDVGNGSTPSKTNADYWHDGAIPWITSSKVHDVFIRTADQFVTAKAKDECHLPLVPKGSLVVAITGQGKTLGNTAKITFDTCINQHLAFLRPKGRDVVVDFLLAYLQTRYADLRQAGSSGGTTKGALTCGFLEKYPFPMPSHQEQRIIARAWRFLTRRIHVAERKRSLLEEMFNDSLSRLMSGSLHATPLLAG